MCTYCEHYVPPDTFRATQFRDLAGLDFPFHFFFVARFSFFFFVSWKPASNVCSCVLMCRWLAPLFTYARLLVAARSYAWNSKLPFDGRTFPPLVRWPHGRPFRCSDGRRKERTAHCWHFEALLVRGIFASHTSLNLHAPSSKGVFAPVCAAITVNSQPTLYQC